MKTRFRERRRNYFIKKKFQRNFIIKFCALVAIGSLISGAIIYLMSRTTVTTTFEDCRLTIKSTADYILPAVLLSSAIVVISIGVAAVLMTLFTSHRIAGPLYRMEKDVKEVASGNLKIRFNLRKTDEIKALAANLDTMVQSLRTDVESIKNDVSELESAIERLEKKEEWDRLKERLNKIKGDLDKFRT